MKKIVSLNIPALFMVSKYRLGAVLALSGALSACTQWHYEMGAQVPEATRIQLTSGTALSDVLAALGPPVRISSSNNGYLMAWEYWRVSENSLGFSLGAVGADLLSVDWGDTRVSGEYLLITFDRDHRLSASSYADWDNINGSGRAIQPSIGLAEIVDVSDLVEDLPHHSWGEQLLGEPGESLNTPHGPDSGNSGIEQRGTPSGVGQRSLEN